MRIILVPVADRPECARALKVAFSLGKRLGANVAGCHIRAHARASVSLSSKFSAQYFGDSSKPADAAWRKKSSEKACVAAKKLYEQIAARQGYEVIKRARSTPGAIWQQKVGSPDRILRIVGPVSDLIVVSRPGKKGGEIARMFMLASLMETARPVLILPQTGASHVGRNICIAWNQSSEAARAVASAMPLLQQADRVTIVSCGPEDRVGPKAQQMVNYLRFWGVQADKVHTRGAHVEKELLDSYRKSDSDLLVMGAYSKSRWRERAFGGTSRFMLWKAGIPVFMLHS